MFYAEREIGYVSSAVSQSVVIAMGLAQAAGIAYSKYAILICNLQRAKERTPCKAHPGDENPAWLIEWYKIIPTSIYTLYA